MSATVPDPDEWYSSAYGIPRAKWEKISDWITLEADADRFDETWDTVATNWLHRVADALDARYQVAESLHFLLLAPNNESECLMMLTEMERAYHHITTLLGELCSIHFGRISVLRFSAEHYEQYTAYYYGAHEGPAPKSSGMYFHGAYPHIAFHTRRASGIERIFAHELTHFCTGHMRLPTWVSEGVAMSLETIARNPRLLTGRLLEQHRAFWNANNVQDFWSGATWDEAGPAFELSYGLAAALYDTIQSELRPELEDFRAFLRDADRRDAGAASARRHLGIDLGDLVEAILGPGDWAPQPWR
jgi:hypothetical protein